MTRSVYETKATALACVCTLAAIGCATDVPAYEPAEDDGSTHAVVTVERSDAADAPRAEALAQFVSVPAYADIDSALRIAGVALSLPAIDTCESSSAASDGSTPLASLGPLEFLDAGYVSISADGERTGLRAHAFPTVSDFASGVVYTTRDRAEEPLPAGVSYVVAAHGSDTVAPVEIEGDAPGTLERVTLSGVPLAEVSELSLHRPIDLTWDHGAREDIVYVELSTDDGSESVVCAFQDDLGAASVPGSVFDSLGPGRFAIHRLRATEFDGGSFESLELRFDFERSAPVEFVE